ncbi:MAG: hypothetical protein QOF78_4284 [Phycisphaerales bacterium]|jgi:hypothetical protein|nr:hypothetical protein [Phycisphaerales bacterium]
MVMVDVIVMFAPGESQKMDDEMLAMSFAATNIERPHVGGDRVYGAGWDGPSHRATSGRGVRPAGAVVYGEFERVISPATDVDSAVRAGRGRIIGVAM